VIEKSFHIESGCRKIAFIDLGASDGGICKDFFRSHRVLFSLGKIELHVHAFEPGKAPPGMPHPLRQSLQTIKNQVAIHGGTVTLYSKAAWISDGVTRFMVGKKFNNTNSVVGSVAELVKASSHKFRDATYVESIDFSNWIQQLVVDHSYDRVYVKMSIGGSEYPVIDKMIKDGALPCIDKLFIEFHKRYPHVTKCETENEYIEKMYAASSTMVIYKAINPMVAHPGSTSARYEYAPRFGWANPRRRRPFLLTFDETIRQ